MIYKLAFLGNLDEVTQFTEEVKNHFNELKNDFKQNKKNLYEIVGSTSKIQIKVFDFSQIEDNEDYLDEANIIIFFSNPNDFLNEENMSVLKDIPPDNQHRFLIGNVSADSNTKDLSQQIFNLMNTLKFDIYFEKNAGSFLTKKQKIGPLTIFPNFYSFFVNQIKKLANIPTNTQEDEEISYTEDNLSFILFPNSKTAKVVKSPSASQNVIIKTIVSKSYTVTEIDDKSFSQTKIKTLSFDPDSKVKRIGQFAFQNSTIESLSIPDSLEEFGKDWCNGIERLNEVIINENHPNFQYVNGLLIDKRKKEIVFAKKDLEVVTSIPNDIKTIGPSSFSSCKLLKSFIVESSSIELIDSMSFSSCVKLHDFMISGSKKVTLGDNCFASSESLVNVSFGCDELIICDGCFQFCDSISSLSFSTKVSIGSLAFSSCQNLSYLDIHNKSSIEIKEKCFLASPKLKYLFLSTDQLSICDDSFQNCTSIKDFNLNAKNDLCSDILRNFDLLTNVDLTSFSTLNITRSSFGNLSHLVSVRLRSKNLILEDGCFMNHCCLSSIKIECENPIKFESNAFEGCNELKSFKCLKAQSELINVLESIDLPEKCFFANKNLEEVEITANNASFGSNCFCGLTKLQKVVVHCKKLNASDSCFKDCTLLDTFTISKSANIESVEKVELAEKCFYNAQKLGQVKIKAKDIKLGYNCFTQMNDLKFVKITGNNVNISDGCFNNCKSLESFVVKKSRKIVIGSKQFTKSPNVKVISISTKYDSSADIEKLNLAKDCFIGANKLETVEISGDKLTITNKMMDFSTISKLKISAAKSVTVEANMFNYCKNLVYVDISSAKLIIRENCFNNNSLLQEVYLNCSSLDVQKNCFNCIAQCRSFKLTNSDEVTFDSNDFCGWENLENLVLKSLTKLNIGKSCFTNFKNLQKVSLFSENIVIGPGSFQNCSQLRSVHFVKSAVPILPGNACIPATFMPEFRTIKKVLINDKAFNGCIELCELIIEAENEISIGKRCFYNLTKLIRISTNIKVTKYLENSFYNCPGITNLQDIKFDNNKKVERKKDEILHREIGYKQMLKEEEKKKRQQPQEQMEEEGLPPFFVSLKSHKKYDSFFVIGIDTVKENNELIKKPSFISMFPSRPVPFPDPVLEQILQFCYPQESIKSPSRLPPHIRVDTNIIDGFVFYFNNGKHVGVVLHFCIPPTANSFVGDRYDRSYPFCVCLISDCPDISSHFAFLSEVIDPIVGKTNLDDIQPSNLDIPETLRNQTGKCTQFLQLDENSPLIAKSEHSQSMNFLLPKLIEYYKSKHHSILSQSEHLLYPTFQTLLSFSMDEIVQLVLAMLCEFKITFISKDLNRASFCVLALTNMIKCIDNYSHIYPYLPFEMNDIIGAPLSLIAGHVRGHEEDDIQVKLDEGKIKFLDVRINIIRNIPYFTSLVNKANILFEEFRSRKDSPIITIPHGSNLTSPEFIDYFNKANKTILPSCFQYFVRTNYIVTKEFINKFSNLFTIPFFPKLREFTKCYVVTNSTDTEQAVSVIDKTMLMSDVKEIYKPFMREFIETSIFNSFKEKIEEEIELSKKQEEIENLKKKETFVKDKMNISLTLEKNSTKRRNSCPGINQKSNLLE